MAGEGSRFTKEGWTTPKPLITLQGMMLFERAIKCFEQLQAPIKYSFIVRDSHIEHNQVDKYIKASKPQANIFSVAQTTRGAVETALLAEPAIAPDDAIVVVDCDLEFESTAFIQRIEALLAKPAEECSGGLLISFNANDPKYSYAQVDADFHVLRCAEKEVISQHALCGAYFFSTAQSFLSAGHELIESGNCEKPEFYLSLLYNILLRKGEPVDLIKLDTYHSYGTPSELNEYL